MQHGLLAMSWTFLNTIFWIKKTLFAGKLTFIQDNIKLSFYLFSSRLASSASARRASVTLEIARDSFRLLHPSCDALRDAQTK